MLTTTPAAISTFDELVQDRPLCDLLVEIGMKSWGDAWLAYDADCAQGYIAVRAYQEGAKELTKVLRLLGWEHLPCLGQERWANHHDYSRPVQFVISKAKPEKNGYRSAPKGLASLYHNHQLSLFEEFPAAVHPSDGYWYLAELRLLVVPEIKLFVAELQIANKTRLAISRSHVLYEGLLFPMTTPANLPEAIPAEVFVSEIEIELEGTNASPAQSKA